MERGLNTESPSRGIQIVLYYTMVLQTKKFKFPSTSLILFLQGSLWVDEKNTAAQK